jgi:type II secretory pathway pseudopilin PulG
MVVISIIAVLASAVLFALWEVMDDAKAARTRAQINKLHELVMARWEEYQTRPVRIQLPANPNPVTVAQLRLAGLRQIMRMELPERKTDIWDDGVVPGAPATTFRTPLQNTYRRHALATLSAKGAVWSDWSESLQGAECLYLIVSSIRDEETTGLDFFKPEEIGDTFRRNVGDPGWLGATD